MPSVKFHHHAVDARLRVVDELEEGGLHMLDVDGGQVHHRGEGVEVYDDAAFSFDGRDVVWGQVGAHCAFLRKQPLINTS